MTKVRDMHSSAVLLHALCQGATVLLDAVPHNGANPAANALVGLLDDITDKAEALSVALGDLNDGKRGAAA